MAGYQSKFRGAEVDAYLDYVKKLQEEGLDLSAYATKEELKDKVDKISGKGLSTEDFTTALKNKLNSLNNYDDAEIKAAIGSLRSDFDSLVSGDTTTAIKSYNDIISFLEGIEDSESLDSIIAGIQQQIANVRDAIPTMTSQLTNDSGFLTEHQDISGKQDKIDDLDAIRSGAEKGATALQEVPSIYVTETELNDKMKNLVDEDGYVYSAGEKVDMRFTRSLLPVGTSIPANANLNTIEFLKIGKYYCSQNVDAKTVKNCPVNMAFSMEVFNPLGTNINDETTADYTYRLRVLTPYDTGIHYIQCCRTSGTPGTWTYDSWYVTPRSKFTLASSKNDGTAAIGSTNKGVYIDSNGEIKAMSYTVGKSVPSSAVFTDTKVTAVGNHYAPAEDETQQIDAPSGEVVTGIKRDAAGHVVGVVSAPQTGGGGEAGGGGGGITVETDPIFSASPAASITEEKKAEWDDKVDKVSGKQLSTEDFTSALKTKLEGLSNYDDTELSNALSTLRGDFDALVSGDTTTAIKSFNNIIAFLDGIQDTQDLSSIIAGIQQQIAGKMDKVTLAAVATSGSYNDLSNKPTIPSKVSQLTNDKGYLDSTAGDERYIKADTAGESVYAHVNGLADSKWSYALPTSANGDEDDILLSRNSTKTFNGESIYGEGNITFPNPYIARFTIEELRNLSQGEIDQIPICDKGGLKQALAEHRPIFILQNQEQQMVGYSVMSGYYEDLIYLQVISEAGELFIIETNITDNTPIYNSEIHFSILTDIGSSLYGSYARYVHDSTEIELQANTYSIIFPLVSDNLTISLSENYNVNYTAEYIIKFKVDPLSEGAELIVPENILWADGLLPAMTSGKTYEISFLRIYGSDNITATFLEF